MIKFLLKNNKIRGFTLVETLVALSIFSMSVVAVMSLLGQGISDTNYVKNKVTAEYLAQEGIEYIRNMRDTYVLSLQNGWIEFRGVVTNPSEAWGCVDDKGCWFDASYTASLTDEDFSPCTFEWCAGQPLKYNSTTGIYGYTSGTDSIYSRKINIEEVAGSNGDQVKVTSTVSWVQGSGRRDVSFSEVLFNWVE